MSTKTTKTTKTTKPLIVVDRPNGKFGVFRIGGTEIYGKFDTYAEAEQAIRDSNTADELSRCDKNDY